MAPLPPPPTPTLDAIYAAYVAEADDGFRDHLGASIIGKECERALWYDFRWVTRRAFSGRMLRLFDTGKREEDRLVRDLRRTGATVLDTDPETGRQWQVAALGGHFGGSLDAVAIGLLEAPRTWHVVEFKTHSAKSFATLKKDGVERAKPQHWAQMQVYMHLTGITRAMYVAVCKDTDEIHIERVRVDPAAGQRLIAKAKRVIDAPRPPARISEDPTWWQCRLCEHHDHCHGDRPAERNCRTCLHSTPVDGGWICERWNRRYPRASNGAAAPSTCSFPIWSRAFRSMPATTGSHTVSPTVRPGSTAPDRRRARRPQRPFPGLPRPPEPSWPETTTQRKAMTNSVLAQLAALPEKIHARAETALARSLRPRTAALQQAVPGQAARVPDPGIGLRRAVGAGRGEAEGADRGGGSAAQGQAAGAQG